MTKYIYYIDNNSQKKNAEMCQCPDAIEVKYKENLLFYGHRDGHIGNGIFMFADDFDKLSEEHKKKLISMNFEYCGYHYVENAAKKLFLFGDERHISDEKIDKICHKCYEDKLNKTIFKL